MASVLNKAFRIPNVGDTIAEAILEAVDPKKPADKSRAVQLMDENNRNVEDAITNLRNFTYFEAFFASDGSVTAGTGCSESGGQLYPDVAGMYTVTGKFDISGDAVDGAPAWFGSVWGFDGTDDIRGESGFYAVGPFDQMSVTVPYIGLIGNGVSIKASGVISGVTWVCKVRGVLLAKG